MKIKRAELVAVKAVVSCHTSTTERAQMIFGVRSFGPQRRHSLKIIESVTFVSLCEIFKWKWWLGNIKSDKRIGGPGERNAEEHGYRDARCLLWHSHLVLIPSSSLAQIDNLLYFVLLSPPCKLRTDTCLRSLSL